MRNKITGKMALPACSNLVKNSQMQRYKLPASMKGLLLFLILSFKG
jgi:hypothetical protein